MVGITAMCVSGRAGFPNGDRLIVCWCVGGCVAQSIRVEAYIPQHVADELDRVADNRSEYIREAVKEKLDGERVNE